MGENFNVFGAGREGFHSNPAKGPHIFVVGEITCDEEFDLVSESQQYHGLAPGC